MGKGIKEDARAQELEPVSLSALIHRHVRIAIETAVHEEMRAALGTSPYERSEVRRGYRNGVRERPLTGPTGPVALTLPRATLFSGAGAAKEWTSRIVSRYQRRMPVLIGKGTKAAAASLGVPLQSLGVRDPVELDRAFAAMKQARAGALIVESSSMLFAWRERLAELALKNRLPTMFAQREYAAAGGLMAYSADFSVLYRRAATFVDKILKGAKPADLPIEKPTKWVFVVNLKTAKALGLTIPQSLLVRADQIIE